MKSRITIPITMFLVLFIGCNQNNERLTEMVEESESDIIITKEQYNTANMKLGEMSLQQFSDLNFTTGFIDVPPENKVMVSVYYGGVVKNLKILIGQKVKKGELLFSLENPEFLKIQQSFLTTKEELEFLRLEYERIEELYNQKVESNRAFVKARSEYFKELASFNGLKEELKLINISVEKLAAESISSQIKILAPISGRISEVNIKKGQYLDPNFIAVGIINSDKLQLELDVYEKNIKNVKIGQLINFTTQYDNTEYYSADIISVGNEISLETRSVKVRANVKNSNSKKLLSGMFINAEILSNGYESYALPISSVIKLDDNYFAIILVDEDENEYRFKQVEVEIGTENSKFVVIKNHSKFDIKTKFLINGAFNLVQ